ncbi:kinase-like domain-containing protein [Aspergillus californicus]
MGISSRLLPRISKSTARNLSSLCSRDLFEYTSGRFLFNEELRRFERRVPFNVDALSSAACSAVRRPPTDLVSTTKLAEGGFNRVLQVTFSDGYSVIARIPFRATVPKQYAVASEAATLGFLRSSGIPVPKVLTYSPDPTNPVGAEYIILEKMDGTPLSAQWFSMDNKARVKIMKQIVQLESRFMALRFPASGSLYYRRDLINLQSSISLRGQAEPRPDDMVVGPTAQHGWWYKDRALLDVDRGPWADYRSAFDAPAKRETEFCKRFGRPRLHVERYLRELHKFKQLSPETHIQLLSDFSKLSPSLEIPSEHPFSRPTLRHPDFSLNNILINSSNDISGIIDWQHAVILPLCLCAGIPDHFQNWGDPMSETLAKPDVKLPEHFKDLSQSDQEVFLETRRKRLVHFYYAALTMGQMPDHFDALRSDSSMLRAKLFSRASMPWEGDSLSLKHAILQAYTNWPMSLDNKSPARPADCPVQFSKDEAQNIMSSYNQEAEKMQELSEMRDMIGTDAVGWVPDAQLERSAEIVRQIKEGLLEQCETEAERTAVVSHFPFDDHDEDSHG